MTLSAETRTALDQRDQLTHDERNIVDTALTDMAFRAKSVGLPLANDDRLATLEAAFIRYLLASRAKLSAHAYTEEARERKWVAKVSPATNYGYYEHDEVGEGGGLWFSGKELTDFDGRGCLPRDVAKALISLGYTVDPINYVGDPL